MHARSRYSNSLMALDPQPGLLFGTTHRPCSMPRRLGRSQERSRPFLVPMRDVEMQLPAHIGDYTDFYASIHHATRRRQAFPPRQPAAAELQVCSDRISRSRLVDRRQWHSSSSAQRTD